MKNLWAKAEKLWKKWEAAVFLIGIPAAFLVWLYANFSTATALNEAKADVTKYVDNRHSEVKSDLEDIKAELRAQRSLQEKILLRVR